MSIRAQVLIPVYRHGATALDVVDQALELGFEVLVVDDGCDEATAQHLRQGCASRGVTLLRHAKNMGKGMAVWTGMDELHLRGCTHAITVDADGQHHLPDALEFLKVLGQDPHGAVFGEPIFDESVPKARLHGRKVTQFFGRLEMRGNKIKDLLFGFRVYPLAPCLELFRKGKVGFRMDFDPEIAVRLAWSSCTIHNHPSPVRYFENGVSNFRMLRDNLRLSAMHTRLITSRILGTGIPQTERGHHWAKLREVGSPWGLSFMSWVLRNGGRWPCLMILYPVVFYFFLTQPRRRELSRQFLERVRQHPGAPDSFAQKPITWRTIWTHHLEFARACLDKSVCWAGKTDHFELDFRGYETVYENAKNGKGSLLIGSHLGNVEILRAFAKSHWGVKVNVFMYTQQGQAFQAMVKQLNQSSDIEIIPVSEISVATSMLLKEKIERGELVALLGDRIMEGDHFSSRAISFLGEEARFPDGPHLLAYLLRCPAYSIFSLRQNSSKYLIHMDPLFNPQDWKRGERDANIEKAMVEYVKRLEKYTLLYPTQWFNFYDFWATQKA
jgi:predicted LPLAT superfamily acyltransferase